MTTFDRLRRALRANLNDLMDRAAGRGDPLGHTIGLLEEAAAAAKAQLGEAAANLAELERDRSATRSQAQAAEQAAISALRAGDEAKAREHLARKLRSDAEARDLEAVLVRERGYLAELRGAVAAIDAKLAAARARAAGVRSTETDSAADEWAERIERLEAEADALGEIDRDRRRRKASAPPVDDQLRHLKEKLDPKT